ncbi:thiolase family protein [Tepidanaerobacter syntrophicus]|uniref:Acetyl-CoA acetyltransferase n=1 Tax=Tepidanaerobacter syntrophicus TaxID=224999 RepID=A0A0U9HGD6_9FIRM|nr:thiolase family protein [Tepidanaerobacter syntrophicus]GAQ25838.1 acetyl-CoA C-acetyltransferase [Tepidanaerobacter syntrophicus]
MREAYILEGLRTPIGRYGGSLKSFSATDLGSIVIKNLLIKSQIDPKNVEEVIMGCTCQNGENAYASRTAALKAGLPVSSSALTVNRLCGSGLDSINIAAQKVILGINELCVAGGMESMSNVPYLLYEARWGARLNDVILKDGLIAVLTDPILGYHMGVTAENLAKEYSIEREEQDATAYESHMKALKALKDGFFKDQIIPIELKNYNKNLIIGDDECPRPDTSIETLSKLKPAFDKNGTVTAGNSSPLNDAAAAVVIASEEQSIKLNIKPKAKIRGFTVEGVEPSMMGLGPVKATQKVLKQTGIKLDDIDVIECNEAFAAQYLACSKILKWDMNKVNPNGGAIALGHPLGATGGILMVKALWELERIQKKFALITMCIGGGQGIATLIERVI